MSSDKKARVHGNKSNRASARSAPDRKVVYKSVLDSPFRVKWPAVPLNVQNAMFARVIALVDGVAEYHLGRERDSRQSKRARSRAAGKGRARLNMSKNRKDTQAPEAVQAEAEAEEVGGGKKRKLDDVQSAADEVPVEDEGSGREEGTRELKRRKIDEQGPASVREESIGSAAEDDSTTLASDAAGPSSIVAPAATKEPREVDMDPTPVPPAILSHLTIGINEVTKRLEQQAKLLRHSLTVSAAGTVPLSTHNLRPIKMVLVCRDDVDPPVLCEHLPQLVASCNAFRGPTAPGEEPPLLVRLIPLSKGAESTLSQAVGLRRASVIAFDAETPGLAMLDGLLSSVPAVTAPWLAPPHSDGSAKALEPTHTKQIRTSAPKDLKAAKEARAKGKAAAKERGKTGPTKSRKKGKVVITS